MRSASLVASEQRDTCERCQKASAGDIAPASDASPDRQGEAAPASS
jgi:hypothetical protein